MSHDQKPARVRVVAAAPAQPGNERRGGDAAIPATGAGDAGTPGAATKGGGGTMLLALLFVVAAAIGGALTGVLLP